MSRNRQKHKQERKRRHERQIEEGIRQPKEKVRKPNKLKSGRRMVVHRTVKLSEIDRDVVRKVIELVKDIKP